MTENIVVLIDGENISHRHYPIIKSHLLGLSASMDCRIYGDWSRPQLHGWKEIVIEEGFKAVHQFNTRKNATDFELVMDAMELLITRQDLTTFCIVSSDSDFSNLCLRLKSAGKSVIVMGENKTPIAYRNRSSAFITLGNDNQDSDKINNSFKTTETRKQLSTIHQEPAAHQHH